jgi:hypothetical protein
MTASPWFLRHVSLFHIFGFYGLKDIAFQNGLQVIEASNHTGKTNLAMALIWGLTGQIPAIDRILATQFKIKNKLAGDKDKASIDIALSNQLGNQLLIHRSTKSGVRNSSLTVTLDSNVYTDEIAQEVIFIQLGLKPQSMEGCCVVLRDQQLNLIAGNQAKSSEVIHDILGLSTLSKLFPIIKNKIKDLNKLVDTYSEIDPIKKWEERHLQLKQELSVKEQEAVNQGFDCRIFLSSQFLKIELSKVCDKLEIPLSYDEKHPQNCILTIQNAIKEIRNRHSYLKLRLELADRLNTINHTINKLHQTIALFQDAAKAWNHTLYGSSIGSKRFITDLQVIEAAIESKKMAREVLREQQGLFAQSLTLLNSQTNLSCCPLCLQSITHDELLKKIKSNLEGSIQAAVENCEGELKELQEKRAEIYRLQVHFHALERSSVQHLDELSSVLKSLNEQNEIDLAWLQQIKNQDPLEKSEAIIQKLDEMQLYLRNLHQKTTRDLASLNHKTEQLNHYLEPLNEYLTKISMYLLPIHDLQNKLLDHDERKKEKGSQVHQFQLLLHKAKKYLDDLEKFKNLIQIQEKEKANQVIQEHQSAVSNFFAKVAANPHYDKITITAKEMHGSVKYDFEASSSTNSNFTDVARNVLSGGDLSCACLGLMLSLTKGKSNKSGFLLLDDPGECFDGIRIENFAREVQSISSPQTIILTHQSHLAKSLREYGAVSVNL